MTSRRRAGFTLVEMLIALAIFGMLTAAGVALLSMSARTQETSDRLLAEVGDLRRMGALMTADLVHAVPRLRRDARGTVQPAFAGGDGGSPLLLLFTRRSPDASAGPPVRTVAWRLDNDRLERVELRGSSDVDGAARVPQLEGVSRAALRYRSNDGEWHDRWESSDPTRLPVALEIVTETRDHGVVRQLFAVGTQRR